MFKAWKYVRYDQLMEYRRMKDMIEISMKTLFNLILEPDKKWFVRSFLVLSTMVRVFFVLIGIVLYMTLSFLYGEAGIIFLLGFFCLAHHVYLMITKMTEGHLHHLKTEFSYLLRIGNYKGTSLIRKRLSYEIIKKYLLFSTLPFLSAFLFILLIDPGTYGMLGVAVLFAILNYLLSYLMLYGRLSKSDFPHMKGLIIFTASIVIVLLVTAVGAFDSANVNMTLEGISAHYGSGLFLLSSSLLVLLVVGILGYMLRYAVTANSVRDMVMIREQKDKWLVRADKPYQKLLARTFRFHHRLTKLKIMSLILITGVMVAYPFLHEQPAVSAAINLLLFCYLPWLYVFSYSYYLYEDLLSKNNIYTTYYLQKRYRLKPYITKLTYNWTVYRTAFYLLLPGLLFVLIYQPMNLAVALGCYLIVYFASVRIIVLRIYQTERFSIEELMALDPKVIISKLPDNIFLFGLPIVLVGPTLTVQIIQDNLLYTHVYFLVYTFYMLLYVTAALYTAKSKEHVYVNSR
ncbi:hypothetical protein SAMN05216238_107130 [Lentibacillus persicus]|uniref:Uncharacterized protein n=1 Tax=Lentibacillus persicus TaxID=640948 RepID=A0A1I1X6Y2_9BACI|nr:hypothetical protein [Lentibacillus persicus]SFE03129.1 hypothetical protein SAMN05216238_107130 [Lentibacillus persicus]